MGVDLLMDGLGRPERLEETRLTDGSLVVWNKLGSGALGP